MADYLTQTNLVTRQFPELTASVALTTGNVTAVVWLSWFMSAPLELPFTVEGRRPLTHQANSIITTTRTDHIVGRTQFRGAGFNTAVFGTFFALRNAARPITGSTEPKPPLGL